MKRDYDYNRPNKHAASTCYSPTLLT